MIKALIGLGNPGTQYTNNRHNIGFRILDVLAAEHYGSWSKKDNLEYAEITINNNKILLIKPLTFMNSSGAVIPWLQKKGIKAEEIVVVHDELELPFGKVALKLGGSAKGHNGLKSIIERCGDQFYRLRFGIGRPERKEDVPDYVLSNFSESESVRASLIEQAISLLTKQL